MMYFDEDKIHQLFQLNYLVYICVCCRAEINRKEYHLFQFPLVMDIMQCLPVVSVLTEVLPELIRTCRLLSIQLSF